MKTLVFIFLLFSTLQAEIFLVGSQACTLQTLSKVEVKQLFMKKIKTIDTQNIEVIDTTNKQLYKTFLRTFLHKTPQKMKVYWARMLFSGRKIPPKKLSFKEIQQHNNTQTCTITYTDNLQEMKNFKEIKFQ